MWGLVATALVTALDLQVTRLQDALAVVVLAGSTPANVMMAQVVTVLRRVTPPVTRPRTRVVLRLLLVPGQNLTLLQFAESHRALGPSDVGYPLASNLQGLFFLYDLLYTGIIVCLTYCASTLNDGAPALPR